MNSGEWPPFLPSPGSLIDGIIGFVAGLFSSLPLLFVVGICATIKGVLNIVKHKISSMEPLNILFHIGEVIFNLILVFLLRGFLQLLLTF